MRSSNGRLLTIGKPILRVRKVNRLFTYGLALFSVALPLWLCLLYQDTWVSLFFLAVMVSAWYGGLGPGLVATVLSILAINYCLIVPNYSLAVLQPEGMIRLSAFAIAALLISGLNESRWQALRREQQLRIASEAAQIEAQETKEQLERLLSSIQDGVYTLDHQWCFTYVSDRLCEMADKSREEMLGANHWELFPDSVNTGLDFQFHQAMHEQVYVHFEYLYPPWNRWFEYRVYPSEQGITVFVVEITERKQAEAKRQQAELDLRASEERFRLVTQAVDGLVFDWHLQGNTVYRSEKLYDLVGIHPDDVPPEADWWQAQMHPDDLAQLLPYVTHIFNSDEQVYKTEYRVRHRDGHWVDVWEQGSLVRDERGQVTRIVGCTVDVSDRKRSDAALRRSEERLRVSQELSLDAFTILESVRNEDGQVVDFAWTYVNPKAGEILGYLADELVGKRLLEVLPGNRCNQDLFERYARVVDTGTPHDIELRYEADGIEGWFRNMAVKLEDGVAVFFSDITKRKRAEAEREQLLQDLANERAQFEAVLRQMPAGVIIARAPAGQIVLSNQQAEEIWGYSVEVAENIPEYRKYQGFHEDGGVYEPEEWPLARSLMQGEVVTQEEIYFLRSDGTSGVMEVSSTPIYNQRGQIISGVVIFQDITQRKQIEEALKTSEERLRFAVEGAALGTWEYDLASSQVFWSEQTKRMFGVPLDAEVNHERFIQAVYPEDRDRIQTAVEKALTERGVCDVELRSVGANGSVHWIRSIGSAQYDAKGTPTRMIGVALDITARKQAEVALRQSEERYRYLVEVTPQLVWTADAQGHNDYVNQQMCDYVGLPAPQILRSSWQAIVHPEDWEAIHQRWLECVRQGLIYEVEFRIRRLDGVYRWHLVRAIPLKNDEGQVMQWIGVALDIHNRQELEEELSQLLEEAQFARAEAERANRIKDEFLAVVSHELRSPLNPILGWAKLLRTRQLDAHTVEQALEVIERNAQMQAQLINDLLDVSRILRGKLSLETQTVNLASTIQAAIETVRLAAEAKSLQIHTHFASELDCVLGDPGRLQQIVWNLLSNAVKFTPEGGQVEVQLRTHQGVRPSLNGDRPSTLLHPYAQITVKDNGKGITPEFLPYVFEQFRQESSTTTRRFGGLGLGLAIVRYLVEMHGGTVQVDSPGDGMGATFTVNLPLLPQSRSVNPVRQPLELTQNLQNIKILVVDDDDYTRDFLAFLLQLQGAEVRAIANAAEALATLPQFQPNLLLSDIGMPDMDGYMLMQQVRALPPEQGGQIPAIALTAYAGELDQQQAQRVGFQKHLSKPVEPETLMRAIASLVYS